MSGRATAVALAVFLPWAGAAFAFEEPVLELDVLVDRTELFIHQQAVLELRLKHRLYAQPRWEAPTCEGFWVERLPSIGGPLLHPGGREAARTTVWRRALFPTRTGALKVPPSLLRMKDRDGDDIELAVPGARVQVRDLPSQGRPAAFSGIVGPVEIQVSALREDVRVGEAVGVEVDVFGAANVWDAQTPPIAEQIAQPVEVFPERPVLLTSDQDDRLTARRRFRFDVVPQGAGAHEIAAISVSYFDPATGAFETARSEPVAFHVRERAAVAPTPATSTTTRSRPPVSPAVAFLVATGALVAVTLTARILRRLTRSRAERASVDAGPETLLEAAVEARGTAGFAALAGRAVRARVRERHGIATPSLTARELGERIDDAEALALLSTLEDARFGTTPLDEDTLLERTRQYVLNP